MSSIVRNDRDTTMLYHATFSTLWPPSRRADVAVSVCTFCYATPSLVARAPLHGGDLLCASRCFRTRLGIQVMSHPLRVPSAPFARVCGAGGEWRGEGGGNVIGSDNGWHGYGHKRERDATAESRIFYREFNNIGFESLSKLCRSFFSR